MKCQTLCDATLPVFSFQLYLYQQMSGESRSQVDPWDIMLFCNSFSSQSFPMKTRPGFGSLLPACSSLTSSPPYGTFPHPLLYSWMLSRFMINLLSGFGSPFHPPTQSSPPSFSHTFRCFSLTDLWTMPTDELLSVTQVYLKVMRVLPSFGCSISHRFYFLMARVCVFNSG